MSCITRLLGTRRGSDFGWALPCPIQILNINPCLILGSTIQNDVTVSICEDKIKEDEKWDGLKAYVTNTKLPASTVVSQYHGLWVVERAFRISKNTLETRPIFHFTERRIEAHVCLCFVAYKVYKELERIVTLLKLGMSVDTVLKIAKTITTIRVKLPLNNKVITRTMMLTPQHRSLQPLFDYLGI